MFGKNKKYRELEEKFEELEEKFEDLKRNFDYLQNDIKKIKIENLLKELSKQYNIKLEYSCRYGENEIIISDEKEVEIEGSYNFDNIIKYLQSEEMHNAIKVFMYEKQNIGDE